ITTEHGTNHQTTDHHYRGGRSTWHGTAPTTRSPTPPQSPPGGTRDHHQQNRRLLDPGRSQRQARAVEGRRRRVPRRGQHPPRPTLTEQGGVNQPPLPAYLTDPITAVKARPYRQPTTERGTMFRRKSEEKKAAIKQLKQAQEALDANTLREKEAGITWETNTYLALNDAVAEAEEHLSSVK